MYDLIIVGGGPAAAAASFYALDKHLNAIMVYEDLGGKVGRSESLIAMDQIVSTTARPHLPANDLVRFLISRTMREGRVVHDRVVRMTPGAGCWCIESQTRGALHGTTVLLATGASPRRLNVPDADRLINPGMSYSITTYAQHVVGQRVAVIGSTERALLGVAELARTAARIYLIATEAADLQTSLGEALRHQPNVEVYDQAEVIAVDGATTLEALTIRVQGQLRRLTVQRAFVDLGLVPNSELVRGLAATDDRGFVVVDRRNATTVPGLYAAGDVTISGGEQALVAMGDGARAAMSAHQYVLTGALTQPSR